MAQTKNYYQRLGLNQSATQPGIKKAYRRLVLKHHPDHGGSEANFRLISEAYKVLSDKEKRQDYDQQLRQEASQGTGQASAGSRSSYQRPSRKPEAERPQTRPQHQRRGMYAADFAGNPPESDQAAGETSATQVRQYDMQEVIRVVFNWLRYHPKVVLVLLFLLALALLGHG